MLYARVALPTALPEPLSYRVPEPFAALAQPGVRAKVPLRGRPRVGLVVAVTEEAGCPEDRILDLDEILDPAPLLPPAVLDLAMFTADYYLAPLGTVVRAAVPTQLLRLPPPLLEVGARAVELVTSAEGGERDLLERVIEARRVGVARLVAEGWDLRRLEELVERLVARHALRRVERRPPTAEGRTVAALTLADLPPQERRRRIGRAPAQAKVAAWLEDLGRPELEAELRASCGVSAGVIAELVRKGVVRRFRQRSAEPLRLWELPAQPPVERLTEHQEGALASLRELLAARRFAPVLLRGVTGSGKTEVYLRLAEEAAAAGRRSLILVPEIGLTPQLAGQLVARFGERAAVLHSAMAEGDRLAAWDRARRGEVDVVAGPRSALWAPLEPLGVIVVDEEQDASYKQDEEPRYNARDLALVLGQRLSIPVVLTSATPSLEAVWLGQRRGTAPLMLPDRVGGGSLPEVEVLDLRGSEPDPGEHGLTLLSPRLKELLSTTLARREQAILLVNRRGWAPVLLCRECGHQEGCRDCSIPMTVHRRREALVCHYCGFTRPVPARCSRCGGAVLDHVGAGTEKVAARVRQLFPRARTEILDRDTSRSPGRLLATLERFAAGDSDVLVGTQMVSKGHHFPRVTLTAVVSCDNLLGFPDFRGAERTFQLLTQVAGRAGRGERPGTVLLQTYHPDHHAIRAAARHDVTGFIAAELRYRRAFRYPPCHRMALVRWEAESESAAWRAARAGVEAIAEPPGGVRLVGPTAAPLARLRGRYRVHLMLFAATRPPLRAALERVGGVRVPRAVRRIIDIDPQSTV